MWTRADEEKRLCELWLQEPLINPETGHPIDRGGPTFNAWRERCRRAGLSTRPTATKVMTWRKCQEWRKNPGINPDSGRKIKENGPLYKKIAQQCKLIEEKAVVLLGEYYVPDLKGMVPGVFYRNGWYVVRKYQGRQIWGPLNKPAKNVRLVYFMDTWDYIYNHYRPIFIGQGGRPPRPNRGGQSQYRNASSNDWLGSFASKNETQSSVYSAPKKLVDTVVDLFVSKEPRSGS